MRDDLKPCPFCGKGAIKGTAKKNGKTLKFAGCINELCSAERWKLPIGQWNNRKLEEEIVAHYKSQIRAIDVALNGEKGAAKQASACDLIAQISSHRMFLKKIYEWSTASGMQVLPSNMENEIKSSLGL